VSDWLSELSPDERSGWDDFVDHFRRDALQKINDSAFVASLIPRGDFDVKFAVELGTAIMLDKPILAITMPGASLSAKLRDVADRVVELDVDTDAGRQAVARAIKEMLA
jgi:hypothetical protein